MQVSETAFANASSDIEARVTRWLLMCRDRVESDDIPLSHEFVAMMLGVSRFGLTVAPHVLERMQVIRAKRGMITVLHREKLKELADEAYSLSEAQYTRLLTTEP